MPYISHSDRMTLNHTLTTLGARIKCYEEYEGILNYCISTLINDLLKEPTTYAQINRLIGVLECAKLELYRRIAAPHEDKKIEENGDVYGATSD